MTEAAPLTEGWGWPSNSRKAHYFVAGRSLCRRWGWFAAHGPLQPDEHRSPDDCAPCRRAVDKRRDAVPGAEEDQ